MELMKLEEVRRTPEYLRERRELYYLIYRVMLESGARFEHVGYTRLSVCREEALVESIERGLDCIDTAEMYDWGARRGACREGLALEDVYNHEAAAGEVSGSFTRRLRLSRLLCVDLMLGAWTCSSYAGPAQPPR